MGFVNVANPTEQLADMWLSLPADRVCAMDRVFSGRRVEARSKIMTGIGREPESTSDAGAQAEVWNNLVLLNRVPGDQRAAREQ